MNRSFQVVLLQLLAGRSFSFAVLHLNIIVYYINMILYSALSNFEDPVDNVSHFHRTWVRSFSIFLILCFCAAHQVEWSYHAERKARLLLGTSQLLIESVKYNGHK